MKRVIVVPISDAARFHGLEVIARNRSLAALVGDTAPGRSREAYDSDEAFLEAVSCGYADRYTFPTLDDAALFAKQRLEDLAMAAKSIEDSINQAAAPKLQPKSHTNGWLKMLQNKKTSTDWLGILKCVRFSANKLQWISFTFIN